MNTGRIVALMMGVLLLYASNMLPETFALHGYSAFSTSSGTVSVTESYSFTIVNRSEEQVPNKLGSLTIGVDPSFIGLGVPTISSPPSKRWTCSLSDYTISCRANNDEARLKGKEMLSVSISATPTSEGKFEWVVSGFHSRNFMNKIAMIGSQPIMIVEPAEPGNRPNIIIVLTDDQKYDTINYMPTVQKMAEDGILFTNAFVSYPLSAPSRTTLLSGQYGHNHGVIHNAEKLGGIRNFNDKETAAIWLKTAGYTTALIGKYMPGYKALNPYVPPGWNHWNALEKAEYYDYLLNENGVFQYYGTDDDDYSTDVLTQKALAFLQESKRPFFLLFTPAASHLQGKFGFPVSAPRHVGTCDDLQLPINPNFNETSVDDKPKWIKQMPAISSTERSYLEQFFREQVCSLKAVDEAVADIMKALGPELDNTVIIFTSDNGYSLGEHRMHKPPAKGKSSYREPIGKNCVYEECIRVPLIIRYRALGSGTIDNLVQNIDLAPTILDLANARGNIPMDGKSLLPLIQDPSADWRSTIFIESYFRTVLIDGQRISQNVTAIRDAQFKYAQLSTGERELYNMVNDPYELENRIGDDNYAGIAEEYESKLRQFLE